MIAAGIVLLWLLVLVGIIAAVAWVTRRAPRPLVRDSELASTVPAADAAAPPVSGVWRDPPRWQNTVPTAPVPLDDLGQGPRP